MQAGIFYCKASVVPSRNALQLGSRPLPRISGTLVTERVDVGLGTALYMYIDVFSYNLRDCAGELGQALRKHGNPGLRTTGSSATVMTARGYGGHMDGSRRRNGRIMASSSPDSWKFDHGFDCGSA